MNTSVFSDPGVHPPALGAESSEDSMAFHAALISIDRTTTPTASPSRELHQAVEALLDAELDELPTEDLADLLVPVHRVLTVLEGDLTQQLPPIQILELLTRIDDALDLIQAPDLSRVPIADFPGRFRELYTIIARLRAAYERLRAVWHQRESATGAVPPMGTP
jgi:hypothetical protein